MEGSNIKVICLQSEAFYSLIDSLTTYIKEKHFIAKDKWVGQMEAMKQLNIKSKTTLQKLRDTGKIRFTQPERKIILYDTASINEYLEKHVKEIF